jgi:hypothetical protein
MGMGCDGNRRSHGMRKMLAAIAPTCEVRDDRIEMMPRNVPRSISSSSPTTSSKDWSLSLLLQIGTKQKTPADRWVRAAVARFLTREPSVASYLTKEMLASVASKMVGTACERRGPGVRILAQSGLVFPLGWPRSKPGSRSFLATAKERTFPKVPPKILAPTDL